MFKKPFIILILTVLTSVSAAFCAFAADSFPFTIEFEVDEVERLCYAGHSGGKVNYRDGIAVTPDTGFNVSMTDTRDTGLKTARADISDLSAEISLIYENESNDGSCTEILKTYDRGSLEEGTLFQILSDNNIANLRDRGKLYSNSLKGLVVTFSVDLGNRVKKKNIYLYVCDYDDLEYFQSGSM